jgi:two-component system alkaline phosphatase synthesis response regulator PhoP
MSDAHKILIVDDEPHVLCSLGFVLRRAGYDVVLARTGTEGLAVIERQRPDVVFLDVMLPGADGHEVCRRLRAAPELAGTHVIMLTAKGEPADRQRALAAGADDYMTKPFSPSRALERVHTVLSRAG